MQINVQKDGQRRSFYSSIPGRNGQRECNSKADEWLDDNITGAKTRVEKLFDDYSEEIKATTSKSNWLKFDSFGRNRIKPKIGMLTISQINEQHLQDIIDKGVSNGLSKKTLLNLKAILTGFIKFCRKRKATKLLPENLTIPKSVKLKSKQILQPESLIILFGVDTTLLRGKRVVDEYINAYRFQVLTGLRPGELMGLQWEDIEGNMVYLKRSLNAYNEITTGKNENAIRRFALDGMAAAIIESQKKISEDKYVFGETCLSSYSKRWARYCEANDIPHISLYELRHTFVSVVKSLPEGQLKPIIGHSKNMDTFGTYGKEVNGELQNTAININAIFKNLIEAKEDKQ